MSSERHDRRIAYLTFRYPADKGMPQVMPSGRHAGCLFGIRPCNFPGSNRHFWPHTVGCNSTIPNSKLAGKTILFRWKHEMLSLGIWPVAVHSCTVRHAVLGPSPPIVLLLPTVRVRSSMSICLQRNDVIPGYEDQYGWTTEPQDATNDFDWDQFSVREPIAGCCTLWTARTDRSVLRTHGLPGVFPS